MAVIANLQFIATILLIYHVKLTITYI